MLQSSLLFLALNTSVVPSGAPVQDISLNCDLSTTGKALTDSRFDGMYDESGLFKLLRAIKAEDALVPKKNELDEAFIAAVEREKNTETITWKDIGREGDMRFSIVIMSPYKSARESANDKQWLILLEGKAEAKWKPIYVLSVCSPSDIESMIADVVHVNSQKKMVSFEKLTQELKLERRDFLMTKDGLREIPIKPLLDKALKPYADKGESFSSRLPMDWKELTYRVTGKKDSDCSACNTGTPLEVKFKWNHENLEVEKVRVIGRK